MPWKDQRARSQKLQFIEKASARGANTSALCREYGISRQTGHKWIRRYREEGHLGLVEQSRRPRSSPLATGEEIVVSILELRDRRSTWGPDKISRVLARKFGEDAPSKSTVARVLSRLGKTRRRRPRIRLWSVDGRPLAILCDNGSPFVCTRARGGLTKLSAWLVSLGIRLVRSRPGCPQDNGGHERMHRDLSELQLKPARSRRGFAPAQQTG